MKKIKILSIFMAILIICCLVFGQPPIQPIVNFFLDLHDTPSTYSGQDGKYVKVDETNEQLIFDTPAGSGDMTKAVYDVSEDGYVDGNDVAYSATWNGDVNAPSMNAIYDKIETLGGSAVEDDVYGAGWNGDTTHSPSQNAIYDYLHQFDADDDGSFTDEAWLTGWTGSTNITTLGTIGTGVWQGTAIADAYIPNNITIDLATLATTVTVSDDESTADNQEVVFTTDNTNLESDGDFHYNPSTGTLTATAFSEGGTGVYNITESDAVYQPLEATLTDIADGTINENLVNTANPWAVNEGGTGTNTLTEGGILLGSGTGAITALGVATNGQIPIGDGTTDPVLATITGTANEITVTNGVGTINLSLPNDAGTDISSDLEEETHASEHAVSGADSVFPADPGADRYLMWDDDPGQLVWQSVGGGGDMLKSTYDVSDDGFVDGNDVTYASTWNGDVNAPSMNSIYDYLHQFDADDDGSFTDETWLTNWTGSTNITTLGTIATGTWNGTTIDISSYTNLVAGTNITLAGDTLNVDDSFLLNTGDTGTGVYNFGGATSFEMVNGANPTIDEPGEYGLDTTRDQLIIADAGGTARVYGDPNCEKSITIADDGTWDNEAVPGPILSYYCSCTIIKVLATVNGTSTPSLTYNIEERAWGSYNSAGTDIYSSDQAADADGEEETSFSNAGIAAKAKLYFTTGASSESGTVNYIAIDVIYRIDRQ